LLDHIYARLHRVCILDETVIDQVIERYLQYSKKWKNLYPDETFLSMHFVLGAILQELGIQDVQDDHMHSTANDFESLWKNVCHT
jgi:hypothetical protein